MNIHLTVASRNMIETLLQENYSISAIDTVQF